MARDDYNDYGWRGRQQSGQWRPQGQSGAGGGYAHGGYGYRPGAYGQGSYGQGGYGQGGYGPGWFGQGGSGEGGYVGGYGQGGSGQGGSEQQTFGQHGGGQPAWQGREHEGMYGQPGQGQGGYRQGWSGQGAYGEGRVAWPEQREMSGRVYSHQEYGSESDRDRESWRGGYGQGGFSGQQSYQQGQQGYPQGQGQQEIQRGQFAGRGPKGYKRADDRIREDVNEELTRNPYIDATDIEVKVESGEVTLSGTVNERRAKRLAEDLAERCSGVREVHNQLRVNRGQAGSERESGETKSRTGRSASSATS